MQLYIYFLLPALFASAETGHTPVAPDARVPRLAAEVRNKGWIAYSAKTANGDWDLFVMRPDGSKSRNITNTPDVSEMGARFSPDGKKMLYRAIAKSSTIPHDRWGAMGKLVISNADGSHPVTYGEDGEY